MTEKKEEGEPTPVTCGVVMPLSAIDVCGADHWQEVQAILFEAITKAGFVPRMVSDADDVGVIHGRIVQNLYEDAIVVCDVSAKNPNVMFELGLRLAFDKPTVVVKDDVTAYSFDTSPVEHLSYPRTLRHGAIVNFKAKLAEKILGTHKASIDDPKYSPFLKHFGTIDPGKLSGIDAQTSVLLLERLEDLSRQVSQLKGGAHAQRIPLNWLGSPSKTSDVFNEVAKAFVADRRLADTDPSRFHEDQCSTSSLTSTTTTSGMREPSQSVGLTLEEIARGASAS